MVNSDDVVSDRFVQLSITHWGNTIRLTMMGKHIVFGEEAISEYRYIP